MKISILVLCLFSIAVFSQDACQQCREHIIDMETQQKKDMIDGEIPRHLNNYMWEKQDCDAICRNLEQQRYYENQRQNRPSLGRDNPYYTSPTADLPPIRPNSGQTYSPVPVPQQPQGPSLPPGIKYGSEFKYIESLGGSYKKTVYEKLYPVLLDSLVKCKRLFRSDNQNLSRQCIWKAMQRFRYTDNNEEYFKRFVKLHIGYEFEQYVYIGIDEVIMHILYYLIPLI